MKVRLAALLAAFALAGAPSVQAISFDVDALLHSSNISGGILTGTPLNTGIALDAGDVLYVSAAIDDCWSAGAPPRVSNANGLTGAPTPCQPGANFGLLTLGSFSAPFGALVGRIGSDFYLLGTSFSGPVLNAGVLELMYWDTFTGDNTGFVTVEVEVVPEPATGLLALTGLAFLFAWGRRPRG